MVSVSSSNKVKERTKRFCKNILDWKISNFELICTKINTFLNKEYEIIPEKERVGKGKVFISRHASKEFFFYLKNEENITEIRFIDIISQLFKYGEKNESLIMQHFALLLLSECVINFPQSILQIFPLVEKYANHKDWQVRESAMYSLQSGLKVIPDKTLEILSKWAKNENNNLRRVVAECLRPHKEVMWLRNPRKNDKVLKILTDLRKDPSIYVRKAVGNNIKDLSKYMPEKMIELMESWINNQIKETNMRIHDELAMEEGLSREEKRLIWTIKHGMRWIRAKNPEYNHRIEKILGKNYVLYFDEKKNRLAKP